MRIPAAIALYVASCLVLALTPAPAVATPDPLFATGSTLEITLTGPFGLINRKRDKDEEYPGTLSYTATDGATITLDVKYSVRGNFRLKKQVCSSAQLWVNLKKSQVKDTLFDNQDKLKLVVQCKGSDRYSEYVAREQQVYLMFEELSDFSLATRLLRVTYIDSAGGDPRTHLGFFIEHQRRLAKQLDMEVLDAPRADRARLDQRQSALVAIFMYMVANTDYSLFGARPGENCCHNIKVLRSASGNLYPVPYDFDSTGYVNASYAEPSAGIRQFSVRQRIYRGYCVPADAENYALSQLREKRDRIYAIIGDTRYVSARSMRSSREFIDDFYAIIDDPDELQDEILGECR